LIFDGDIGIKNINMYENPTREEEGGKVRRGKGEGGKEEVCGRGYLYI